MARRPVVSSLLAVLVAFSPPAGAAVDGALLRQLRSELEAAADRDKFSGLKDPSDALQTYTTQLTRALYGFAPVPDNVPPPQLTQEQERDLRGSMRPLAKLVTHIFKRRAAAPTADTPNDTGGLGGLFWKLDGGTRNRALVQGGFEHSFSRAVADAMLPPQPAGRDEACSAVCKTLERMGEWGYDGSPVSPTWSGSSRINSEGQWAFAIYAMEALFVVEAAPLCPSVSKRAQVLKGVLDRWIGTGKLDPGTLTRDGKFGPAGLHYSNLLLGRLRDFAEKFPDLSESVPESLRDPRAVRERHSSVVTRLANIVKDYYTMHYGLGGSNLELHTLTSFLSGLGPGAQPVMAQVLENVRNTSGAHPVCKIPYDPVRFPNAVVNPRESAGRCVPFYLAKFLVMGNSAETRRELLLALENWGDFAGDLLFHVPRNGVHAYGSRDQLAPYYYPPTVLPSLSAAQLLVNAASSGPERDRALAVLDRANRAAMGAYRGEGRWVHPTSEGGGFFGKGAESFATTGPATAMAMVCAANGEAGAYGGVVPASLNRGQPAPERPRPPSGAPAEDPHVREEGPKGLPPQRRERAEETRTPEETLGAQLREQLPSRGTDAATFVRDLSRPERRPLRNALRALLGGDRSSPGFARFRAAAGNPSDEVIAAIASAFEAQDRTILARTADPNDALNVPWVEFLTDRSISLHRKDQAVSLLNRLREAARGGDARRDDLYGLAARWAASLGAAQRSRAKELLERLALPGGDGVPEDFATTDAFVRRVLFDALERHSGDGGASAGDGARDRARAWARQWNQTLREAVPGGQPIDWNREITVHEDGGRKTTVRAWAEATVQAQGYDDLVRWATSVGGETGEKTLALLARLDANAAGGTGAPQVAVKPSGASSVTVATGPGTTAEVRGPTVLELGSANGDGPSARTHLARMLPTNGAAWEHGEFVRPKDLGTGPHARLRFDGDPTPAPDDPAPPRLPESRSSLHAALGRCVGCHGSSGAGPRSVEALEAAMRRKSVSELGETLERMKTEHGADVSDTLRAELIRTYAKGAPPAEAPRAIPLAKFTSASEVDAALLDKIAQARAAGRRVHVVVTHENCLGCRGKPEELRTRASRDRSSDLFVSVHYAATRPPMRLPNGQPELLKRLGLAEIMFPAPLTLEPTGRHDESPPSPRAAGLPIAVSSALVNCTLCHVTRGKGPTSAEALAGMLRHQTRESLEALFRRMAGNGAQTSEADKQALRDHFAAGSADGARGARGPSSSDAEAIRRYEELRYPVGDRSLRERFSYPDPPIGPPFKDVPAGGTGKLILAYFGTSDDPELTRLAATNPLVEVRRYPPGSPEHRHAQLFNAQALAVDGLGRKLTRYAMSPREALRSLLSDETELRLLREYLEAKRRQNATPPPEQAPPGPPPRTNDLPPSGRASADIRATSHFQQGVASCVDCHQKNAKFQRGPLAPLRESERLVEAMAYMSDGHLSQMLAQSRAPEEAKSHVREYVRARRAELSPGARSGSDIAGCFFSESEVAAKRRALPRVAAGTSLLAAELDQARGGTVFLPKESPVTELLGGGGFPSVLRAAEASTSRVDSLGRPLRYWDHGMLDWNWAQTAGIHGGPNVEAERFMLPPPSGPIAVAKEERGEIDRRTVPFTRVDTERARWLFGTATNLVGPRLTWQYQPGVVFGEVLKVKDPGTGQGIPFEVRLRKKLPDGSWHMDVLRPFENPAELRSTLSATCAAPSAPPECADAQVAAFLADMAAPKAATLSQEAFVNETMFRRASTSHPPMDPLKLNRTAERALQALARVHTLPPLPPALVRRLLTTTPFKSVFGKPWVPDDGSGTAGWAPTSASDFNIVPRNYFGAFLPTNRAACMNCHGDAGGHVDNFNPTEKLPHDRSDTVRNRTWYGPVPGNDGIFMSWWDRSKVGSSANFSSLHPCLQRGAFVLQR